MENEGHLELCPEVFIYLLGHKGNLVISLNLPSKFSAPKPKVGNNVLTSK